MIRAGVLITAEPLPAYLVEAVVRVSEILNLPNDWLNNGPAAQFDMGLPEGFSERLTKDTIGYCLNTISMFNRNLW